MPCCSYIHHEGHFQMFFLSESFQVEPKYYLLLPSIGGRDAPSYSSEWIFCKLFISAPLPHHLMVLFCCTSTQAAPTLGLHYMALYDCHVFFMSTKGTYHSVCWKFVARRNRDKGHPVVTLVAYAGSLALF